MIFVSKKSWLSGCLSLVFMVIGGSANAQTTITGPTCVVPGVVYQYSITGPWDSTSTMQVCLTGGVIADSSGSNTCTPAGGAPLYSVLVLWNGNGSASLTLTASAGNANLNISVTMPLSPGSVDSSALFQTIGYDSVPQPITCTLDSGGSCSPTYSDQWQQSPDMLVWTDISGATSQNLTFNFPLTQTTFFRRKVTEAASGSIAYSNAATVDVLFPIPQGDSTIGQPDSVSTLNGSVQISNGFSVSGAYRKTFGQSNDAEEHTKPDCWNLWLKPLELKTTRKKWNAPAIKNISNAVYG